MDDVLPNRSPYIPRIMQVSQNKIRLARVSSTLHVLITFPGGGLHSYEETQFVRIQTKLSLACMHYKIIKLFLNQFFDSLLPQ